MIEIFHYPEEKIFKTSILSRTFFFYFLTVLILFLAPLIILCYSKNIWQDFKYLPVNMGPCFLEPSQAFVWVYSMDDSNHTNINLWSGMDTMLNTMGSGFSNSGTNQFLLGSLNYFTHEDPVPWPSKNVGKLTYKAIEISVDIYNVTSYKIIGKRLLIPVTCGLHNNNDFALNVTGLIWNEFLSQTPIVDLFIQSELIIKQTQALKLHGMNPVEKDNYMRPILNANTIRYNSITSQLNNAIYDVTDRNLTLHLGKTHHFMSTRRMDPQLTETFHITLVINLSEQELLFETPFIYQLKWAYIYYIGIWIIFYWPIQWLQRIVLENRRLINDNLMEFQQPPRNVYLNHIKNEW
ncbi:hypothetical protein MN116_007559 [Schistosoma mekongi]|uniref:Transmembrane protein 231 n=1 Tax=Schistosoma mekongi TaxID=38744 RepID=A0AAE1Z7H2_SCHME|nr:hypothetical protein MN116_007559 [Schistosoma mekongi]